MQLYTITTHMWNRRRDSLKIGSIYDRVLNAHTVHVSYASKWAQRGIEQIKNMIIQTDRNYSDYLNFRESGRRTNEQFEQRQQFEDKECERAENETEKDATREKKNSLNLFIFSCFFSLSTVHSHLLDRVKWIMNRRFKRNRKSSDWFFFLWFSSSFSMPLDVDLLIEISAFLFRSSQQFTFCWWSLDSPILMNALTWLQSSRFPIWKESERRITFFVRMDKITKSIGHFGSCVRCLLFLTQTNRNRTDAIFVGFNALHTELCDDRRMKWKRQRGRNKKKKSNAFSQREHSINCSRNLLVDILAALRFPIFTPFFSLADLF